MWYNQFLLKVLWNTVKQSGDFWMVMILIHAAEVAYSAVLLLICEHE